MLEEAGLWTRSSGRVFHPQQVLCKEQQEYKETTCVGFVVVFFARVSFFFSFMLFFFFYGPGKTFTKITKI